MAAQDFRGSVQWLIIHDGITDIPITIMDDRFHVRFIHRKTHSGERGARSLAANLLHALIRVKANKVIIIEDDDYYHTTHLKDLSDRLEQAALVGSIWQKYYNIQHRLYLVQRNIGSALCSTGFRANLIERLQKICSKAYKHNQRGIDRMLWDETVREKKDLYNPKNQTCIGIKGLPGTPGIGHGHRPRSKNHHWKYHADPKGYQLVSWVGKRVANLYFSLVSGKHA
jgi:hypothetical protein